MDPSPAAEPVVRFRAGKKRKAYRQRIDDDDTAAVEPTPNNQEGRAPDATAPPVIADADDDDESSVAAALRLRNARRSRIRGVAFKNAATKPDDETPGEHALVLRDPDAAPEREAGLSNVGSRFMHQTGLVADMNDKHMMEYIESRLSSRASAPSSNTKDAPSATASAALAKAAAPCPSKPEGGHAVMQGKLMEIDLGDEARDINVARTERFIQHGGSLVPGEDVGRGRRAKKPRLGRDGKPWRPRNRRPSDAIMRDQIVEEVLRESRLDVYEAPVDPSSKPSGADEDGAADDRLAEEFRRQFLDDVAQRQLKKKKPTAQAARPGAEDVLKGPKLGGSRNVRAAMRDLLLKKEKEGKK
ncbi:hypothetical protein AK830_g8481 [Neonectria ditissima]|uniref:Uncharacterized protein n=1 Tax=Neonectria ditissima TaxID=78410 RepID=A0A0P7B811_9HYPO|nr:hypothetical protein AK830_g8481 [Neonectria ditissima]